MQVLRILFVISHGIKKCLILCQGKKHKKTILLLTVGALLAVVVAVAVSLLLPESARGMRRCAVVVECEEWNEVSINGIPTLYGFKSLLMQVLRILFVLSHGIKKCLILCQGKNIRKPFFC